MPFAMGDRDHTFAIALIASVLLHAAIVFVVADDAVMPRGGNSTVAIATRPKDVSYVVPPASAQHGKLPTATILRRISATLGPERSPTDTTAEITLTYTQRR